jgi:hypothetical protein
MPPSHTPGAAASYGYFDSPATLKERSTVGSASATGSLGGNTYTSTWASGSEAYEDKMSEDTDLADRDRDRDHDDAFSSVSNASDEGNASLVGFGEGASSTISGPTSRPPPGLTRMASGGPGTGPRPTSMSSNVGRSNPLASYLQQQSPSLYQQQLGSGGDEGMAVSPAGSNTPEPMDDARMVDGMTFDSDVVDTTARTPRLASPFERGSEGGVGGGGGGFGTPRE